MQDLSGQSFGRYHITERLGEGGMALVYKAYDTRLERDVALKVIRTEKAADELFLKRFEREARALAQLSHPNIVHINDYGEQDGAPYLVMDYMPGGTLKDLIQGPMEYRQAARLLLPVARALHYAHSKNILHRDVKPGNILITESGEPMLTDFGIARILESDETADLTSTGMGVGTPSYMAPEQTGRSFDHRVDVYALGVVFYEMVTGRTPYRADTPLATLMMHASDPLPDPKKFVSNLPQQAVRVLVKALQKKPDDRYSSMGEFAAALEKLAGGMGAGDDKRSPRWVGWAALGAVVVALAAAGVFLLQGKLDLRAEVPQEEAESAGLMVGTPVAESALQAEPTAEAALEPALTREELLIVSCGEPAAAILDEYNVVFQNDFSENSLGIDSWGADLSVEDGLLINQGHGQWKGAGHSDWFYSGKGYLLRYRMEKIGQYHISIETGGYGNAAHRWWGITGSSNVLRPETYFGENFSRGFINWQQDDLTVAGQWLCVFLAVDDTTFTTKVWDAADPAQISVAVQDMGPEWEGFHGCSSFAAESGVLEIDSYSELTRK